MPNILAELPEDLAAKVNEFVDPARRFVGVGSSLSIKLRIPRATCGEGENEETGHGLR